MILLSLFSACRWVVTYYFASKIFLWISRILSFSSISFRRCSSTVILSTSSNAKFYSRHMSCEDIIVVAEEVKTSRVLSLWVTSSTAVVFVLAAKGFDSLSDEFSLAKFHSCKI